MEPQAETRKNNLKKAEFFEKTRFFTRKIPYFFINPMAVRRKWGFHAECSRSRLRLLSLTMFQGAGAPDGKRGDLGILEFSYVLLKKYFKTKIEIFPKN